MKNKFRGMRFKQGSYSSLLTIIVIAIVIIINMAAAKMPTRYAKLDVSDLKLYSIGEQTTELLVGLDKDVDIYLLCQNGNEDDILVQMLERYESGSNHITVTTIDPVANPAFAKQYTEETIYENSLLVVSDDAYRYISYEDMYTYEANYETYSYDMTGYDGEGLLTSAIAYVTSDSLPKMYILTGHNEAEISAEVTARLEKNNMTTEELSLLTLEAVPEDCDVLLINSPLNDLAIEEVNMIISYLDNGGNVIALSDFMEEPLANYDKLLEHYGISRVEGMVIEGDSYYHYPNYPYYVVPDMQTHTITTQMISDDRYLLLPSTQGLEIGEAPRANVEVNELLVTSDAAYSKVNVATATTVEKEDGDIDGPFVLGVAATEEHIVGEETKLAKLVYVTTGGVLNDSMNNAVSGGNYDFFMNVITWMNDETVSVSIEAKSLSYDYLSVTAGEANFWGIFMIGLVPIAILVCGVVVWVRRRRR